MLILPIPKTVAEIAELVGGKAEGELSAVIEGASTLQEAGPKDISFLGNPKYAQAAAASAAGCLLLPVANRGAADAAGCAAAGRIYVDDPQYAFSQILAFIEKHRPSPPAVMDAMSSIHHQARLSAGVSVGAYSVVARDAVIGEDTRIGPQCYIGENARIGRNCRLYPQVVIRENCVVGDRAIIHSGTVIGADGFGFTTDRKTGKHRKIPQLGNVVISDDVEIGANVTIDRATIGSTVVGSGTKIDNLVQLAHNVQVGKDCFLVSQSGVAGSSELGDRVILAGQAGVAGHLRIADGAIIMAQTGVMSDVDKNQIMFGYPAKPRWEAFKLQALYAKLPEIYEAVKEFKKKLKSEDPTGAR